MAFQSCPKIAECVIHFTSESTDFANVLHFYKPDGYGSGDIEQLANDVDAEIASQYLPWCSPGISYLFTSTRGLENVVDWSNLAAESVGPGTFTGTLTLPFNCSFCLSLRSASSGRSARGRFYAAPTTADALISDNTVSSTYRNGIVNGVQTIMNAPNSDGWFACILSRQSLGVKRVEGIPFLIVDVVARNDLMDSQRGRLPHGH